MIGLKFLKIFHPLFYYQKETIFMHLKVTKQLKTSGQNNQRGIYFKLSMNLIIELLTFPDQQVEPDS